MSLEGNLKDFSLPEIFRLIGSTKKTGTLHLKQDKLEGTVCFQEGEIFFATSNWNRTSLGQRLVKTGKITEKQLRQALGLQKIQKKEKQYRRLGQILVDEGYIAQDVLESTIKSQIIDTVFDLLRWDAGEYYFEPDVVPLEEDIGISVNIENVIMEGARRLEAWQTIKQKIRSLDEVFEMASSVAERAVEIRLKPMEWKLLCLLDGKRTIADLIKLLELSDFHVCKIIYGLYSVGLIERVGEGPEIYRKRVELVSTPDEEERVKEEVVGEPSVGGQQVASVRPQVKVGSVFTPTNQSKLTKEVILRLITAIKNL